MNSSPFLAALGAASLHALALTLPACTAQKGAAVPVEQQVETPSASLDAADRDDRGPEPAKEQDHPHSDNVKTLEVVVNHARSVAVNAFQKTDDRFWAKVSGVSTFFCGECGREVLPKVQEWWAVSDWLGDKLSGLGEAVYHGDDTMIWGRTTAGLTLEADEVVAEVATQIHGDK